MNEPFLYLYNVANYIAAISSLLLFLALLILPTKLYRHLLRPYRHIFFLMGVAWLNDAIRKTVSVLALNEAIPFWLLIVMAWITAFLGCIAVGFFCSSV